MASGRYVGFLVAALAAVSAPGCRSAPLNKPASTITPIASNQIERDISAQSDSSATVRNEAQARLVAQGDDAVPALLSALRVDGVRRRVAEEILPRHPSPEKHLVSELARMVGDPAEEPWARRAAATALGRIGPRAKAALTVLLDVLVEGGLPNPAVTRQVQGERTLQRAIVGIGAAAAVPVARLLTNPEARVRIDAAWVLEQLGPSASPAMQFFAVGLRDEWVPVRAPIARLLVAFDSIPPALATVVLSLREDSNADVREAIQAAVEKFRLADAGR